MSDDPWWSDKDRAYKISGIILISTISVLAAVLLFDHNFEKQESHCNTALCADVISISSVSFGILSIGNPISVGIVSFSSFVAIGVISIAPISIGILPIGLATYLGYQSFKIKVS